MIMMMIINYSSYDNNDRFMHQISYVLRYLHTYVRT